MNSIANESSAATRQFQSDENRWAAVVGRDRGADDAFHYSVRTTGVYCRPSCSSRLARRENVRFHVSAAAAEQAGFRPCRRCRPNEASLAQRQVAAVATACRLIEKSGAPLAAGALADAVGMSRFHFHRVFRAITGQTLGAYLAARRANRVRDELSRGETATVTDAIYNAGFSSAGRFYAGATKMLGMTPREFRAGGAGTAIRFAVGESSLGSILVAASEKGICAILLGDDPAMLAHDLQDRFPKARLTGGDATFEEWVAKVVGFVEVPRLGLGLPLDVRGTAFQGRVWEALCAIPAGSTASYTQIARNLGMPSAVRAIARACAANNLAVAIPCHRVVRHDGSLSGYRWGVERKRALLAREAAG